MFSRSVGPKSTLLGSVCVCDFVLLLCPSSPMLDKLIHAAAAAATKDARTQGLDWTSAVNVRR